MKVVHLNECEKLNQEHNDTKVAYQKDISHLKEEHVEARKQWDAKMQSMEERHTADLVARDVLLANREEEHKKTIATLIDAHNKVTEDNRVRHCNELAARLAENHANEQKFLADVQGLRD